MLGAQAIWAGKDLYRATPTSTRDLSLYGRIRETNTHVPVGFDWLITYGFTSRSRIFHFYGGVTVADEGLQKKGFRVSYK
jgi:hypothetical protein